MKKLLGTVLFLLALYVALLMSVAPESLGEAHFNVGNRLGHYGIIGLGAALVIITGGIDLSIGSVVALSATLAAILLMDPAFAYAPVVVFPVVLGLGVTAPR